MEATRSPWQGRRALIVGCDEFVGRAVTSELLEQGATVVGVLGDRRRLPDFVQEVASRQFHVFHGSIRDAAQLHKSLAIHEVACAFHFAETDPAPLLRAASLYHSQLPVIGTARLHSHSHSADASTRTPLIGTLRFDEIFGPGDRDAHGFIPRAVLALLAGRQIVPASGASRNFVFVRDVVRVCLDLAEAVGREGRAIHRTYSSGWEYPEPQMVKILASAVTGSPPELLPERFTSAISETIDWYRQFSVTLLTHSAHSARRAA
jgi:nucleoside-diphosphate-sugar epimerase